MRDAAAAVVNNSSAVTEACSNSADLPVQAVNVLGAALAVPVDAK